MLRLASRLRIGIPLSLLDAMLVAGSYSAVLAVRFGGAIPGGYSHRLLDCLPVVIGITLAANFAWGLYGPIWRYASVVEARRLVLAGTTAAVVVFVVDPFFAFPVNRTVAVLAAVVATMFMGLVRFQARLFSWKRRADRSSMRIVIVGAGSPGASIISDLSRMPAARRRPVAVVDDDARTHGRSLLGVPVVGAVDDLERVVARYGAEEVLVADPNADQTLLRNATERAERVNVPVRVLPPTQEFVTVAPTVRDVRDIQIDDLLGRQQVVTDRESIRAAIASRRVLITGAGGSIGSEIAIQVASCEPACLILLDHDESHLHEVAARLPLGVELHCLLTDIRDRARLESVFERLQPELVFHAAAHKHVPLLEADPVEAVLTNVCGTENVLAAATVAGVERLVFISSDKAVQPTNVLGRSKFLGEQLVVDRAPAGARWCSVRFGNVIGSRGSVIPTFSAQIASGGPVTVTDPRMTRYFMSVHEAVTLALQAAVYCTGGEIFMLNVGEPVNILELAERMIRLSGRRAGDGDIEIELIGARPGDALSERLHDSAETAHPTEHAAITRLSPIALAASRLNQVVDDLGCFATAGRDEEVRRLLDELMDDASTPTALIESTA